jgi:hypothetical protein
MSAAVSPRETIFATDGMGWRAMDTLEAVAFGRPWARRAAACALCAGSAGEGVGRDETLHLLERGEISWLQA